MSETSVLVPNLYHVSALITPPTFIHVNNGTSPPRRNTTHTSQAMSTTNTVLLEAYFETLGIRPTTDLRAIKAAYARKALHHHPDKSATDSSTSTFAAVQEAWEVLRAEYQDKTKHNHDKKASTRKLHEQKGGASSFPIPGVDFEAWNIPNWTCYAHRFTAKGLSSVASINLTAGSPESSTYRFPPPPAPVSHHTNRTKLGCIKDEYRTESERRAAARAIAAARAGSLLNPWMFGTKFTEDEVKVLQSCFGRGHAEKKGEEMMMIEAGQTSAQGSSGYDEMGL